MQNRKPALRFGLSALWGYLVLQKRFQALHAPEQGRLLLVGVGVGELEKALAAAVAVVGAGQLTLVGQGNQDGQAVSYQISDAILDAMLLEKTRTAVWPVR